MPDNIVDISDRRQAPEFLSEEEIRTIHRAIMADLEGDPLARVEALRQGYEGLSQSVLLSQFAGLLAGACGRTVDATTGISLGGAQRLREAIVAAEDTAALALELARVLRQDGLGAA